ncbi:ribokinase [Tessaracoccus aquimaris]|uniref:Ribokinase n=1 Tax=Tessaracoccus aquimaris TaxID=1332264 RepID=A0A1Q2CK05_9ACTN|nr:ribokinase [Tessaracoccus aquimaris]AQP46441.1 ribokinase [Tessaracoccus aquimaris]
MGNVVVVGSLNVDLHLLLQRHILPGETLLAGGGTFSPGGKGANQACAAALAGAPTVMAGAIGDDAASSVATSRLEDAGVDLSHVKRLEGPSGLAVVSVDAEGENTVVVVPGANGLVTPEMVQGWAEVISGADVVVLQGEISAESNLAAARLVTGRLVVNLAPVIEVDPTVLLNARPLVVNEHEGAAALLQLGGADLTDPRAIVEGLRAAGIESVVMTVGSAGSLVAEGSDVTEVASPKVKAVDTVGAGDAFCGALSARLAAGDSLLDASGYASRFAAYTVQHEGAQSSYPAVGTELPTL